MNEAASNSRPFEKLNSGDLFMLVNDAEHRILERWKTLVIDGAAEINENGVAVEIREVGGNLLKNSLVPVVLLLARPPKVKPL